MRWGAWLVPALLVAAAAGGCGGTDDPGAGASPPDSSASATHQPGTPTDFAESDTVEAVDPRQTKVFRCADPSGETFRFEVRPRDGRVELWLPGRFDRRRVELDQVRAASGARYEGRDVVYWNSGDEALFRVEGEEFRGCTVDRGG